MKKVYIFDKLSDKADSKLLSLLLGDKEEIGELFQKLKTENFKGIVEFVDDVKSAEAILLPHTYFQVNQNKEYIKRASELAGENSIPLILFTTSDYHDKVDVPNSVLLRTAAYRSDLSGNEVVIPAFVEDLGEMNGFKPREKNSEVPTIGFSGMVELSTRSLEIKYQIKKWIHTVKVILGFADSARYQGLYYRRKVIKVIQSAKTCRPNFYIRSFFSASKATIEGDKDQIRNEFISSIKDSDLALVVRGNGNFSLRFFEVLSLGRVPLFVDTDTPLPLEDEIDYDSFMLRVDHKDINKIPEIVEKFWQEKTSEQFVEMQKKAREIFETKLRSDAFFRIYFS